MNIHLKVSEAIDEIDAALFSGDQFHNEDNLQGFELFLSRWRKELVRIRETLNEPIDGDLQ